jgi:hypothetical protein
MRHSKASGDEEESGEPLPSKPMKQYEQACQNNTEFFSTYNPDMIEEALLHHLKYTEMVEA